MNDLTTFTNPEFGQVRTVEIDGIPWLVGKDVAVALGYKEPTKAVRDKVDPEDRGMSKMDTPPVSRRCSSSTKADCTA